MTRCSANCRQISRSRHNAAVSATFFRPGRALHRGKSGRWRQGRPRNSSAPAQIWLGTCRHRRNTADRSGTAFRSVPGVPARRCRGSAAAIGEASASARERRRSWPQVSAVRGRMRRRVGNVPGLAVGVVRRVAQRDNGAGNVRHVSLVVRVIGGVGDERGLAGEQARNSHG